MNVVSEMCRMLTPSSTNKKSIDPLIIMMGGCCVNVHRDRIVSNSCVSFIVIVIVE